MKPSLYFFFPLKKSPVNYFRPDFLKANLVRKKRTSVQVSETGCLHVTERECAQWSLPNTGKLRDARQCDADHTEGMPR